MNNAEKQARNEFYVWFEQNICKSHEYEVTKISNDVIGKIAKKQSELCSKYNLEESVFDNVLYDIAIGGD